MQLYSPPYFPLLFNPFQFAYRHLISSPFFTLIFPDPLYVFTALDPAPDTDPAADFKAGRITGIPAPGDAWNVIRFSVGPVHRHQKIGNLPSQRCLPIDRSLAYVSVQEDLIGFRIVTEIPPEMRSPAQTPTGSGGFSFLHGGYRTGTARKPPPASPYNHRSHPEAAQILKAGSHRPAHCRRLMEISVR